MQPHRLAIFGPRSKRSLLAYGREGLVETTDRRFPVPGDKIPCCDAGGQWCLSP